jgi:hypothetical protein
MEAEMRKSSVIVAMPIAALLLGLTLSPSLAGHMGGLSGGMSGAFVSGGGGSFSGGGGSFSGGGGSFSGGGGSFTGGAHGYGGSPSGGGVGVYGGGGSHAYGGPPAGGAYSAAPSHHVAPTISGLAPTQRAIARVGEADPLVQHSPGPAWPHNHDHHHHRHFNGGSGIFYDSCDDDLYGCDYGYDDGTIAPDDSACYVKRHVYNRYGKFAGWRWVNVCQGGMT